jgi:redox-sensitive bicupin YhaK (pirin superfamily)
MIGIRKKKDIFHIKEEWFEGYWHFSFGSPPQGFYDPENTDFGTLRVHNVDTLVPGGVWPMHPHRDIEVITYCLDGEFQHADETGKGGLLHQGDVQHTTVGRGMYHEEINYRKDIPMTFLQIWIMPRERGLEPSVQNRSVNQKERLNGFLTLVSNQAPDALPIAQDAEFVVSSLQSGKSASHQLEEGSGAYLYVASGKIRLGEHTLSEGDAAKIFDEPIVSVEASQDSELAMVVVRL